MNCPSLEVLFDAEADGHDQAIVHARSCGDCSQILAEHRALEVELFALNDPHPPFDLIHNAMARIDKEIESRAIAAKARHEVVVGAGVVCVSLAACGALIFTLPHGVSGWVAQWARGMATLQSIALALGAALRGTWGAASLPLSLSIVLMMLGSMAALRRTLAPERLFSNSGSVGKAG